ncbi:MAG: signal peptidase II [Deltaproteobacteria bacterium]|jgi:signal peptidase II|nr:signal peptidase II [Deltaproteobacteria bacterium]MBW2496336.1 signal peptidase II [Deltaproteobacteria bacterium]
MTAKRLAFFGVAIVVFGLDRATKHHALSTLEPGERVAYLGEILSLAHVRVPGAAFGLLQSWSEETQRVALGVLSLACVGLIVAFYRGLAPGEHSSAAALGAVLGGVVGNLLDRLLYGVGIESLHLGAPSVEWLPDFSLSDLAIVLGVVTLIVELLASEMAARAQERPRR